MTLRERMKSSRSKAFSLWKQTCDRLWEIHQFLSREESKSRGTDQQAVKIVGRNVLAMYTGGCQQ